MDKKIISGWDFFGLLLHGTIFCLFSVLFIIGIRGQYEGAYYIIPFMIFNAVGFVWALKGLNWNVFKALRSYGKEYIDDT